ncbi:hypothetical protein SBOR_10128 [Sclerotinia borealis F-4128]|uniref:Pre-mRNA-splicing factor 38B n=1 Tax=Sclerotinia borealis (strain F-4128) TaxID=1432307 RepID=W9C0P3_SCLBF|nr:hypothetical protein SBOR_10128 [Sclerotinia borealis F-4128]
MANNTYLTDDYVADLLAKDAKASSIKYSSMGLEAYAKESKPPANKPKPNTRFLRNIIRDTDNHNSALLAKEAAEARARLESLSNGEKQKKVAPVDIRRRQLGDIKAILGGPVKRKREDSSREGDGKGTASLGERAGVENIKARISRDGVDNDHRSWRKDVDISAELISHRRRESRRMGDQDKDEVLSGDKRRSKDGRKRHQEDESGEDDNKTQRREHRRRRSTSEDRENTRNERRRRHRERSRSPREHRIKESGSRERDRSPQRKRKRSLSPTSDDGRRSTHQPHKHSSSRHQRQPEPEPEQDSDSDPLDSIIGPRPAHEKQPLRILGRGISSIGFTSAMDSRFHADYDPKSDVQLEEGAAQEDDWDQALEALRDRQKWHTQGANRLRDAGFSEEEVKKWERGGLGEKREEDVKWGRKGEGREWDRGKVVRGDGEVGFETGWKDSKDWGNETNTSEGFGRLK